MDFLSADCETDLVQPGLAAPEIVCGSAYEPVEPDDGQPGRLLYPTDWVWLVTEWLRRGGALVGANLPYDAGCIVAAHPEHLHEVFRAYAEGRMEDVLVNQALIDIGRGCLFRGAQGEFYAYNLQICARMNLFEYFDKENTWRLRYRELRGVPFERWPEEAREYPRKDVRYPWRVFRKQRTPPEREVEVHRPECSYHTGSAEACQCWRVENGGDGFMGPRKTVVDDLDPGYNNLALAAHENRANFALRLMQLRGIRTDPEMVDKVVAEVTAKHDAAVEKFGRAGIYRLAGWCRREKQCEGRAPHVLDPATCWRAHLASKVGTKDTEWLKELIRRAYSGTPPMTAGTEKSPPDVSTDRDTLLQSGDPLLEELGEAGANEKDYSQYLSVIVAGKDRPICPNTTLIVKTCRCSYWEPNLQNLPRGGHSRECFVPRPGHVYCSCDYPGLELVTNSQNQLETRGWSRMADALNADRDLHCLTGSRFEGTHSYDEFRGRYKTGERRAKDIRQASKPVNFGLGGGMGAEKLTLYARQPSNGGIRFCEVAGEGPCGREKYVSAKLGKPLCAACVRVAKKFREVWLDTFPEMRLYFSEVGAMTDAGELVYVPAPEGEPLLWCAGRGYSEACNLKFQGRAARLAKDALWHVTRAAYDDPGSPVYGARPVLFIHDEIIAELPEERAHEMAWGIARIMEERARYWCPDVKCPVKPALMRRWFKGADDVKSRSGGLVPWWPGDWSWAADLERMKADREAALT